MKKPKSAVLEALRIASVDEASAVAFWEKERWGDCPFCPRCADTNVYKMMSGEKRNKDYRWRCRGCKTMFTVRTNSPLEETRLPLRIWAYAIWKAASGKKGYSALQLSREMEITHKSSLFVLRRLRHGLGEVNPPKLTGDVEADEVYLGGRPRFRNTQKRGRGAEKMAVFGMVQRGGDVRFKAMNRITAGNLKKVIHENADHTCRLITDDLNIYRPIGRTFEGGHGIVRHSAKEYVKAGTDIHSNTIEGVFSLIQRGLMGSFHSVTRKHLPNYLNEFQFRWNTRKLDDGERVQRAIKMLHGKRLEYRESVECPPYAQ